MSDFRLQNEYTTSWKECRVWLQQTTLVINTDSKCQWIFQLCNRNKLPGTLYMMLKGAWEWESLCSLLSYVLVCSWSFLKLFAKGRQGVSADISLLEWLNKAGWQCHRNTVSITKALSQMEYLFIQHYSWTWVLIFFIIFVVIVFYPVFPFTS